MSEECPACLGSYKVTAEGKLWRHKANSDRVCDGSGTVPRAAPAPAERPYSQPPSPKGAGAAQPMTELGQELAGRIKELFHAYTNRADRNVQHHLGPSEVGTPCDRRLAMSVMRAPAVNPGGRDNWASFVGTCVHDGLARMFMWGDAETGRYCTETALEFPLALMPRGTGDLIDRTLCMFIDHKVMGRWSLDRLRTKGPTETYRTQVNLYAYSARNRGETVDHVAIVGWPREGSNLDDLYVWTEPYDPGVFPQVKERLQRIEQMVEADAQPADFDAADDCKFCPYHAPGDTDFTRGCPGR